MKTIRTFHAVTIGQSHVKKGMPCQDAAISYEDPENEIYIGVVSDGHGSKDYFRSDVGSSILVNGTMELLKTFAAAQDNTLFQEEFITRETITELNQKKDPVFEDKKSPNKTKNEDVLNHLFKSIISKWQEGIYQHWQENMPSEDFLIEKGVSEKRRLNFLNNEEIEIAYGCTILAFLKTKDFWFAFQLGDGMCIAFDEEMNDLALIPKDPQCEGSTTTSMCQSNAFDNFRFAYGTKKLIALFIGSDGMEGRYGDLDFYTIPEITKDYELITKTFFNNGYEKGYEMIQEALPAWSLKDSNQKDDLSFSGWINLSDPEEGLKKIINKEKLTAEQKLKEAEEKLAQEQQELKEYESNLASKLNEIVAIEEQLNELKSSFDQSQSAVLAFKENILAEEDKQVNLKKQRDEIEAQKLKLETERGNIQRVKDNKIQSIEKVKTEKQKSKSFLESLLDKFFGH